MVQGVSARENCPKDILITLLNGPKRFEQIVSELSPKYSRGTINKYLNELYEMGGITRNGRRGPYILTPKGREKAEREKMKQELSLEIDNASLQEIERMKVEKRYDEILGKIGRLLDKRLPTMAIKHELYKLGWNDEAIQQVLKQYRQVYLSTIEEEQGDVILKLVSNEEVEKCYREHNTELKEVLSDSPFAKFEIYMFANPDYDVFCWHTLTPFYPVNGYYVLGAFKDLLDLYREKKELETLKWKFKYGLTDED